jgi:predicted metal-binding membrane protein
MTKPANQSDLTHLSPAEAQLAHGLTRSRLIAIACVVVLAGLGWVYLALLIASHMAGEQAATLGPGMSIFDMFAHRDVAALVQAIYDTICRPTFGRGSPASLAGLSGIGLVFVMWAAMTLAMMLPTAGPMILTYSDIAEAAARKGEPVVSPLVLTAGYLAVWLGFALAATALQAVLTQVSLLDPAMGSAGPLFSGALFLAAGAYQFSALKHACVTLCQRPFPFFLANWSTRARGVFALGLRQGLYCLGCCWAMMLLMLAVGVMNVVWMATLGVVMAMEKIATTTRFSRLVGVVLALIGAGLIGTAILAHWPSRS